MMQKYSVNKLV